MIRLLLIAGMMSSILLHAEEIEKKPEIILHTIDSPYQGKPARIEVLLPDSLQPGKLSILPIWANITFGSFQRFVTNGLARRDYRTQSKRPVGWLRTDSAWILSKPPKFYVRSILLRLDLSG